MKNIKYSFIAAVLLCILATGAHFVTPAQSAEMPGSFAGLVK